MKKKFFMPIFAALALTGCSDDVPGPGNGSDDPEISNGHFLAVKIVSPSGGARSRDGETNNANGGISGYEDGDPNTNENTVTGVRLYFFSTSGDAVKINPSDPGNWRDITPGVDKDANATNTVDQILQTVIMIKAGEILPAKVVAIVNPIKTGDVNEALGSGSLSFSQLQNRVVDYAKYANGKVLKDTDGAGLHYFVMSNTSYWDINGMVDATTISPEHYGTGTDGEKYALEHPLDIYVERTVAKVRVDATSIFNGKKTVNGETLYALEKNQNDANETPVSCEVYQEEAATTPSGGMQANGYEQIDVYLKLDGWDVTADLEKAYLLKKIMNWKADYLGDEFGSWNSLAYHRSFWALPCTPNNNQFYAYSDGTHFMKSFDGNTGVYCNENAETPGDLESTMVLIKGTLCDETGKALTIADYGGIQFVVNETFDGLKSRYIQMYRGMRTELPWRATTAEELKANPELGAYKQLDGSDIEFKPAEYFNPHDIDEKLNPQTPDKETGKYNYKTIPGRYYVYARLTSTSAGQTWYKQVRYGEDGKTLVPVTGENSTETAATINGELLDLSHAMIWNNGMTYYYADIQHGSKYGTVRNHIYDISIDKIYGLGTPVFDDDLVIIPEPVQNDQTFVAARINILQWRVVTQHVNLDSSHK